MPKLTIKNAGASSGKGMNFCLDSVDLKIVHHYCVNETKLNSLLSQHFWTGGVMRYIPYIDKHGTNGHVRSPLQHYSVQYNLYVV
jgi:hypothetical protein